VLARACADPDAGIRARAASTIEGYQERRPGNSCFDLTIPSLTLLLSDPDTKVRLGATDALYRFGAKAAPATKRLIELLDDRDPEVRSSAAVTMPNVDIAERRSVARLLMMLEDVDNRCRRAAARALKAFDLPAGGDSASRDRVPSQ